MKKIKKSRLRVITVGEGIFQGFTPCIFMQNMVNYAHNFYFFMHFCDCIKIASIFSVYT